MRIREFQQLMADQYGPRDHARGVDGTFMWLVEEVGELATALREGSAEQQAREFADVLAWLASVANVAGVDLEQAAGAKYNQGCPACGKTPCACGHTVKA